MAFMERGKVLQEYVTFGSKQSLAVIVYFKNIFFIMIFAEYF